MSEIETVEIVNENAKSGFTRINKSDFDPKVHRLYGESRSAPVSLPDRLSTPTEEKKKPGRPRKAE